MLCAGYDTVHRRCGVHRVGIYREGSRVSCCTQGMIEYKGGVVHRVGIYRAVKGGEFHLHGTVLYSCTLGRCTKNLTR